MYSLGYSFGFLSSFSSLSYLSLNWKLCVDKFEGYDWGSEEANIHHHGPQGVPTYRQSTKKHISPIQRGPVSYIDHSLGN